MSVGTGIECINLKKAKYNRDMRIAAASAISHTEPVPTDVGRADRAVYHDTSRAGKIERTSYGRRAAERPYEDDGYTFKDVCGAIGEELLGAFASYRKKKMRERANAPKYVTKKVKAKSAFPVSVIGYIVVFSVIAMFLVLGNSRLNEATLYADSLENSINEQMNKCEMLTAEVNARNDAAAVEDYAINVLGLVKKTDVAKTYVSISGEDKIVVSGTDVISGETGSATMTLDSGN